MPEAAGGRDVHGDQGAQREHAAARVEVVPAREVAERVGDQPPAVQLEPAQHVRAGAEHEVGARADRRPRERAQVPAVLAEGVLVAVRHVRVVGAFGARVEQHDHDVGAPGRAAHQPAHLARVVERRAPRVRREADERHVRPVAADEADLARRTGGVHARAPERAARARVAAVAEVVRVVVGEVDGVDARTPQRARVAGRRLEREAVRAPAAALRRPAGRERALVVDDRQVAAAQHRRDRRELRPPCPRWLAVGGAERDVAAPGQRDRAAAGGRHGGQRQQRAGRHGERAAEMFLPVARAKRTARHGDGVSGT